jgi:hypothetical protein
MGVACWAKLWARAYGASKESAAQYLKCYMEHLDIPLEVNPIGYHVPDDPLNFLGRF